jgi:hypothetical protein
MIGHTTGFGFKWISERGWVVHAASGSKINFGVIP